MRADLRFLNQFLHFLHFRHSTQKSPHLIAQLPTLQKSVSTPSIVVDQSGSGKSGQSTWVYFAPIYCLQAVLRKNIFLVHYIYFCLYYFILCFKWRVSWADSRISAAIDNWAWVRFFSIFFSFSLFLSTCVLTICIEI